MPSLYYFRAPNFDISFDSPTAPVLGSILPTLKRLTGPLNQHDYVSIPPSLRNSSTKSSFKDTINEKLEGSVGVFADARPLAHCELIYGFAGDKKHVYTCESMSTEEFVPNEDFVLECIRASQSVQDYIEESFVGNKTVYMITGLKVATRFGMALAQSSEHGPSIRIGFPSTAIGIPGEAGVQGDLKFGRGRELEYGQSSRIIFAYRAIKIRPRRDGSIKYKDISGGQYALSDDEEEEEQEWVVEPMDEEDLAHDFPNSELVIIEPKEHSG